MLLGANGQLGNEWEYQLSKKENAIRLLPYTISKLDISNFEKVEKIIKQENPHIIINCAACTNIEEAEKEKKKADIVNNKAVQNMAEICAENNIKLIHFSTDYVFGGQIEDQEKFPDGYSETHAVDSVNWYGVTKWKGEQAIRQSNCEHIILRVSWLCGAFGQNFIKTMLRLAKEHDCVKVVNDQYGSPTFTGNLVKNVIILIEQNKQGTYHFTSDGIINWAEFAKNIFELSSIDMEVQPIKSEEYKGGIVRRPHFSKLNTDKIKQVEGIKTINWKKGLKETLKRIKQ